MVAALTLPNLMTAYNNHITETRLKKFYSTFNQAIRLSTIDNGESEGWTEYWAANNFGATPEDAESYASTVDGAFKKYLMPYMKISYTKQIKTDLTYLLYVLPDGSAFAYRGDENRDIFYFPKNPEKCIANNPNSQTARGSCMFLFEFVPNNTGDSWRFHYKQGLEPMMYSWDGQRESLYSGKTYSCAGHGGYCTALIKQNGWKLPKDYPKKIKY